MTVMFPLSFRRDECVLTQAAAFLSVLKRLNSISQVKEHNEIVTSSYPAVSVVESPAKAFYNQPADPRERERKNRMTLINRMVADPRALFARCIRPITFSIAV